MKIQNAFRFGLIGTLGVGLGLLILMSIVSLSTILTYIGAALFIALGIEPMIAFLERRRFPRWAALVTVLVVIIGAFTALIWAIVPIAVGQATQLVQGIVSWVQKGDAEKWFEQLQRQFPTVVNQENINNVVHWLQSNVGNITNGIVQTGLGIVSGFFGVIVVIILTIYFTASLPNIKRASYLLVPASKRARFADLADQVTDSVGKYVGGQVSLALVNGVLSAIFLTIIGAKFPILLASIAFFFSLIPLVGTITGSVIIVADLPAVRLADSARRRHLLPDLHAGRGIRPQPAHHEPGRLGAGRRRRDRCACRRIAPRHPRRADRHPVRRVHPAHHQTGRDPATERTLKSRAASAVLSPPAPRDRTTRSAAEAHQG